MCMRRRRCLVFAVLPASGQLPRLARAARRAQGRRKGTFRKLDAKNVVLCHLGGASPADEQLRPKIVGSVTQPPTHLWRWCD